MIKEISRNTAINKEIVDLEVERRNNFEKITKALVSIRNFKTGSFYRIIENNTVHVNKTLRAICNELDINYASFKSNKLELKGRGIKAEELKVVDYR